VSILGLAAFLVSADARVIDPVSKSVTPRSLPNNRLALITVGGLKVSNYGRIRVDS
jgi:hypothetical protein